MNYYLPELLANCVAFVVCFRQLVTMMSFKLPEPVTEFPQPITEVTTPCLLVDVDIVQRNAQNMIERCRNLGLKLRPHVKTHKCL